MKQVTVGVFPNRQTAEEAINRAHNELKIADDDISYVYKNTEGEVKEVDASDISSNTPSEGASKGAVVGGVIGAIAGIIGVAGAFPILGPLVAGGALATALGLTGAIGTAAAGAVVGAATGGVVGALVTMGVGKEHAQHYEDSVKSGNILVVTHSEETPMQLFLDCGALEAETYGVTV